jgi:hypothetical protein
VKKQEAKEDTRQHTTMVRVSTLLAEGLKSTATMEGISIAEFADVHLLPVVKKRYREILIREMQRLNEQEGEQSVATK